MNTHRCLFNWITHNRVFSLTWSASMQIYWNKRKRLHKKRAQLPQDWFGTPTWPPFHCFGTPIWPPWRHVKTLYSVIRFCEFLRGVIASYTAKDKFSINTLFLNCTIQLTRACSSITRVSLFASACVRTQNIAAHCIYVTAMRVGRTFVDV